MHPLMISANHGPIKLNAHLFGNGFGDDRAEISKKWGPTMPTRQSHNVAFRRLSGVLLEDFKGIVRGLFGDFSDDFWRIVGDVSEGF